jgi:hypothetical protein
VRDFKRAEPLLVEEVNLMQAKPAAAGRPAPCAHHARDLCDADGRPADASQWRDRLRGAVDCRSEALTSATTTGKANASSRPPRDEASKPHATIRAARS